MIVDTQAAAQLTSSSDIYGKPVAIPAGWERSGPGASTSSCGAARPDTDVVHGWPLEDYSVDDIADAVPFQSESPTIMTDYAQSDAVVVVGYGVGRVAAVEGDRITIRMAEGQVVVEGAEVAALLRRVASPDEAQRLLVRLCERCTEPRSLPPLRSIRELARAPLGRQVEYCRWYFRQKKALAFKEHEIVLAASGNMIAELAMSLGVEADDLLAAIKRGKPVVKRAEARRVLPPAPTLEQCEHLRSFWLGTVAVVGEWPAHEGPDVLRVSMKPGAWHAFAVETPDGEGLLLRHDALHADAAVLCATIDLGGVNVEGGTIGVIDAEALSDPEVGVDGLERWKREDGYGYGDRGVETSTGGDGDHRILVDQREDASSLFIVF